MSLPWMAAMLTMQPTFSTDVRDVTGVTWQELERDAALFEGPTSHVSLKVA